jgi:hypothetical protein
MAADVMANSKARSTLIILLATCQQTLLAVDAVDSPFDKDLGDDIRRVIARSETALESLNTKLGLAGAS